MFTRTSTTPRMRGSVEMGKLQRENKKEGLLLPHLFSSIVLIVVFTITCSQHVGAFTMPTCRTITRRSLLIPKSGYKSRSTCYPAPRVLPKSNDKLCSQILYSSTSSSTSSSSSSSPISSLIPLLSTLTIIVMDVALRDVFKKLSISFPSPLAGCGFLFATLLGLNAIKPSFGDGLFDALNPGATVLAKWLPVFFVPSLVTLPLAPNMGNALELTKVGSVIVGGFLFTLLTTAWSVIAVRKLSGTPTYRSSPSNIYQDLISTSKSSTEKAPAPKAFSDNTFFSLLSVTLSTGLFSAFCPSSALAFPIRSLFFLSTTLTTFVLGTRFPSKITKVVHPLVTCTALTWAAIKSLSTILPESSFISLLQTYKVGTVSPILQSGAGDILLFLLGPAVISLACQMYNRKTLIKQNFKEVTSAILTSSIGGLFGTALITNILQLSNPILRLSLLSRNITSPLAMAIASILGADVSLAVAMVVVSGLIGANFGASILNAFQIKDPVARGLGIGAAAHGLGTAAFKDEEEAFPFAAIAMALVASFSTVLVSLEGVKKCLVKIALGS